MKYLLDTNILLRLLETSHFQHLEALERLKTQNCTFYILLQNVSKFLNVCTRPKNNNENTNS
jgi:predicted nucleic acid-binding protein